MKSRLFVWSLSLLLLAVATSPCFAQSKAGSEMMALDQIRIRVAEAKKHDRRLIIRLKSGGTVSGVVSPLSDSRFELTHSHGFFGEGESVSINYADVANVKGRNPFVKVLKDVGAVSVMSVAVAAFLPIWASLEGLSLLLTRELLPSCSIGN
ncbi:MAG TPA: hypothetical protein VN937_24540 [Blastocatellia bacterium]|nr:hypothetical protein [Blastocatellia bacterium]